MSPPYIQVLKNSQIEGVQKKCANVLLYTTKMIDPRVKSQARGQNNGSRALK